MTSEEGSVVEQAARAMHRVFEARQERDEPFYARTSWEAIGDVCRGEFLQYAAAMVEAVARTVPTREQVTAVLDRAHTESWDDATECDGYEIQATDAVLELFGSQPTVAEAQAQALKRAYRERATPIHEEDAWAFGEGVRAGIDAVLTLMRAGE